MFDVGFFELVVLAIVGLLVLGPERLPHAVRMGSAYMGKIRRAVMTVREEFEREVNVQEMQQRIKEQMEKSGLEDAHKSLTELKQSVESLPTENELRASAAQTETKPAENDFEADTQHSPTLPENEAEPFPEPPSPEQESPKA